MTAEAAAWARSAISPADAWPEFVHRTGANKDLAHLPCWPWVQRPVELGRLSWPAGAGRWACGHWLADTDTLADIRAAGAPGSALPLVIDDGTRSITTSLYLLPPRPLALCGGDPALYLLTLVDDRFFWHWRTSAVAVTGGTTTWAQLFAGVASALGITVTPDAIDADYLKPAPQFTSYYEDLPTLLDAAAASVGQRIVRRLDGTVLSQGGANGLAQGLANLAAGYPKLAGGVITDADLLASLPATVLVSFPQADTTQAPYAVAIGGSGLRGTVSIRDTAIYDGSNATELNSLADLIATDWENLQSGTWDVVYSGVAPWVPDCLTDEISWTHREGDFSTRARRGPWDGWPDTLLHYSSAATTDHIYPGASLVPVGGYRGVTGRTAEGDTVKDGLLLALGEGSATFGTTIINYATTYLSQLFQSFITNLYVQNLFVFLSSDSPSCTTTTGYYVQTDGSSYGVPWQKLGNDSLGHQFWLNLCDCSSVTINCGCFDLVGDVTVPCCPGVSLSRTLLLTTADGSVSATLVYHTAAEITAIRGSTFGPIGEPGWIAETPLLRVGCEPDGEYALGLFCNPADTHGPPGGADGSWQLWWKCSPNGDVFQSNANGTYADEDLLSCDTPTFVFADTLSDIDCAFCGGDTTVTITSGTGGGGSSTVPCGPATNSCCEGNAPTTPRVTLGGTIVPADPVFLTWDVANEWWAGSGTATRLGFGAFTYMVRLTCAGGVWYLSGWTNFTGAWTDPAPADDAVCSPFWLPWAAFAFDASHPDESLSVVVSQ